MDQGNSPDASKEEGGGMNIHASMLTTEPTVGHPIVTNSAENIAGEENSLFDKGLIDQAATE
jgi:hypothetical protein